ncbi:MAG: hypothetical protein KAH20_16445 [Methylococcales bacterium]|nr:hypothetical protein [Methylococcales bacterium]
MTRIIFVLFSLLISSNLFAKPPQPAVAIKEPTVGDTVNKSLIKRLDTNIIRSEMESSFRATRKFRVLSRDKNTMKAILDEQNFANSDLAKGDAASSGNMNNANYLILPIIQDFKFHRTHKPLPNFDNKFKRKDWGVLVVDAQMLDSTSGQIVTTFSLKKTFATKESIVNSDTGSPSSIYFSKMAKGIAAQLASQFVAQVYPMKVVKRNTNEVILNRGKDGGIKIGEKLNVYFAGEALIDPDTGESLGSSEELIGTVEVTRILPKITYAKIVTETDPQGLPMKMGNILRKQ